MVGLVQGLRPKERRGSKPRCHLLTHGSPDEVAFRLTALAAPFATVSSDDCWMPQGFDDHEEAQLHRAPRLLDSKISEELRSWWLGPVIRSAMTPNFDIASTCTIEGTPGLLLVEAKAHDEELNNETAGRHLKPDESKDRLMSHQTIGAAIDGARAGLEGATTQPWRISRDSHYQMSNRFAWAWKLTELGIPVVLVYLGFLRADEMEDRGKPFATHAEWETLARSHGTSIFPSQIWDRRWLCNGQPMIPLIRSLEIAIGD